MPVSSAFLAAVQAEPGYVWFFTEDGTPVVEALGLRQLGIWDVSNCPAEDDTT